MLKQLSNLSLRWKFMLAPMLGILLTTILAVLFYSSSYQHRETLLRIQQNTMDSSRTLSHLASRLAINHASVYELLKYASKDGDEAHVYDIGKPLLDEIHRIEADALLATEYISSANSLVVALSSYRRQIITAVEMSTVDLSLANKFMTQATSEFNQANAQFLMLSENMQWSVENQLKAFHLSAGKKLRQYIALFLMAITVVILISFLLAKLLSRDIHHSINTLSNLSVNEKFTKTRSEVAKLQQVIDHVRENHRKLTETRKDLSQQESHLRAILNNMIDGVITIDEKGEILSFNVAAEKMFGYMAEQMVGENIKKLINEYDASRHDAYIQNYLLTGETNVIGIGREVKARRRDNTLFPLYLSVTELPYKTDGKRCFVGACKDITILKQQEEQLRRAQKMKALGVLIGGVAHDYNNMLGVVIGYSELLAAELKAQPEALKHVEKINQAAERCTTLTGKLMLFSRHKQFDAEILNLNTVVQHEQHMLVKTLTDRIRLTLNLEDDLWPICVDRHDLADAILNICINAMHAMEAGGELCIRTHNMSVEKEDSAMLELSPGDYILLAISDTGMGMDEETISKIFDPFYTTKGDKSTGLGLSQVYGFIDRSGAAIKVSSEPDNGTLLSLYFPRIHVESIDVQVEKRKPKINIDGNETILVVDDEPELLTLCRSFLLKHGYKVLQAENALVALEILKNRPVDILFSDVIMPDMDGFELAMVVQEKYPEVKIQLTSGFIDESKLLMEYKGLYEDIIGKPYNSHIVLKRIRELLA